MRASCTGRSSLIGTSKQYCQVGRAHWAHRWRFLGTRGWGGCPAGRVPPTVGPFGQINSGDKLRSQLDGRLCGKPAAAITVSPAVYHLVRLSLSDRRPRCLRSGGPYLNNDHGSSSHKKIHPLRHPAPTRPAGHGWLTYFNNNHTLHNFIAALRQIQWPPIRGTRFDTHRSLLKKQQVVFSEQLPEKVPRGGPCGLQKLIFQAPITNSLKNRIDVSKCTKYNLKKISSFLLDLFITENNLLLGARVDCLLYVFRKLLAEYVTSL